MTKTELVNYVSEHTEVSKKDSEAVVTSVINAIVETLQNDEKVSIVGFGTFEAKERQERMGINPQTKEPLIIPACKVPTFKAGKGFKDAMK